MNSIRTSKGRVSLVRTALRTVRDSFPSYGSPHNNWYPGTRRLVEREYYRNGYVSYFIRLAIYTCCLKFDAGFTCTFSLLISYPLPYAKILFYKKKKEFFFFLFYFNPLPPPPP